MFANICRNVCKDSNKMFHSSFSLFLFIFFFFLPIIKRKIPFRHNSQPFFTQPI